MASRRIVFHPEAEAEGENQLLSRLSVALLSLIVIATTATACDCVVEPRGESTIFSSEGGRDTKRFRFTYTKTGAASVKIKFEIAPPGKDLAVCIEAVAHREKRSGSRAQRPACAATMECMTLRPAADEYFEYYHRYISLVRDGDIVETLRHQARETVAYLRGLTEEQGGFRYAPEKWSVKECLGHVIDTERIFAYRALRIGRGDATPLAGFEQDEYIAAGSFDARSLAGLIAEFETVRKSTEFLLGHLASEAWTRRGTASGHGVSVRALAYIMAGHERHHVTVLDSKYFARV